ncbi:hypothetical protein [Hydrogenophaga atypica]|uniref:Uncharacterized protein n=1 Tax=Hydrogenophaga atypica TaxID=249409 RepID=A0ABW2QQ93_9BURK
MDKYDKSNAQMIIDGSGLFGPGGAYDGLNFLRIDDRGVWPDKDGCADVSFWLPQYLWKPCWDLEDHPDEPNDPNHEPGLPFPFDEYQLAAWMMGGLGGDIAGHYGDWDAGPDRELLAHPDARKARRGVTRAFAIVRTASAVVGVQPTEKQNQWRVAEDEYGRVLAEAEAREGNIDRARALLIGLREQVEALKVESDAAFESWRRAMVRKIFDGRRTAMMLIVQTTPEYQRDEADVEAAFKRLDDVKVAPDTGSKNSGAVRKAKQKVEWAQEAIERLRGDAWSPPKVLELLPANTGGAVSDDEQKFDSVLPDTPDALEEEAALFDGFDLVALGHELDAGRWSSLPTVQAKHAAMLMAGINPDHYPDPNQASPPNADLPRYRSALNTLESHGHDGVKRSLRDWVGLAELHGLQIDPRVRVAVERTVVPLSAGLETASASEVDGIQRQGAREAQDSDTQIEQVLDYKVLAMPDKLLSVFGGFGLKASHFEKLQGPLKRAQKVPGKPGRGGYPGLFCPYEVMAWMAKRERFQMSEATGWRLLEGHFEATYVKFSIIDPRSRDH